MSTKTDTIIGKEWNFHHSQLKELKEHTESLGLEFICTPFSNYAIDVLAGFRNKSVENWFWRV